jgi:hypothetical protein
MTERNEDELVGAELGVQVMREIKGLLFKNGPMRTSEIIDYTNPKRLRIALELAFGLKICELVMDKRKFEIDEELVDRALTCLQSEAKHW